MDGGSRGSFDNNRQSDESNQFERFHIEPIFGAFLCPLTKEVMHDPVSIENGNTFEREAIEKWFKECEDRGRKPVCPLTSEELPSTNLTPSMALRNAIEEWAARNEAALLDMARRSLSSGTSERDILQALKHVEYILKGSMSNKHAVNNPEMVHLIVDLLRNSSRLVRRKALETLKVVVEQDSNMKEIIAEGGTVRTIVKFLSPEQSTEREEAISLLYELSKSRSLCYKIGSINGAVLILVGMASSEAENHGSVEKAEKILQNLAQCEDNVRQMAESGRLEPLLKLLLEGPPETKLSMANFLGDLALNNEVKVQVARKVGSSLVNLMRNSDIQSREASIKALNQISSYDASAKILIEAGILPPLVRDLFTVGAKQLPMRLKEISATILSNVVNSGYDILHSLGIGPGNETLVSEDILHSLLHLISNTGPSIECKLLQVLVGLTSYHTTVLNVVAAIKSSGATISLVQFIEAQRRDLRLAALKLLYNLSPYMAQDLADALRGSAGQLGCLLQIISENGGITEEQAAAVGLLAELPESDLGLTQQMLNDSTFELIIHRVRMIRQGETKGGRFMTPYQEGLVSCLVRVTYALGDSNERLAFCRENNLGQFFVNLLPNGLDNVQIASAQALRNLARESIKLTRKPEIPPPVMCATIFTCFSKPPDISGLCPVHGGRCSLKETFCLVEGQAAEKLVALLDHTNEKVVEASLEAISTLLEDGVIIEEGIMVIHAAEGTKPIFEILVEKRTELLRTRAVWVVERLLRIDKIAYEVTDNQKVGSALVDAFQHGDYRTRQIAEKALKHVDRIPNFSGIFSNPG